jgi:hypothetical protein
VRDRTIMVVSSVEMGRGKCRYCGAPVLWVTTASQPGRPARTLPFDPPRPWPLRTDRNDDTGVAFEVWPTSALHFASCKQQPKAKPKRRFA